MRHLLQIRIPPPLLIPIVPDREALPETAKARVLHRVLVLGQEFFRVHCVLEDDLREPRVMVDLNAVERTLADPRGKLVQAAECKFALDDYDAGSPSPSSPCSRSWLRRHGWV
ncbi:hypothetical protein I7I48_09207 [Histoplasma ohiense]|nr:hypothetical protein I7I48_09207 [Histoplasma ohiense (nom. inval.)]